MKNTSDMSYGEGNIASYPVIPLRDIVVFPKMIASLFVGRERSIKALEVVMRKEQKVLLLTQKDPKIETPEADDLYPIGVVAVVKQMLKLPDGTVKVLVEGERRVVIKIMSDVEDTYYATVSNVEDMDDDATLQDAKLMVPPLIEKFEEYVNGGAKISQDVLHSIKAIEDPTQLMYTIIPHVTMSVAQKQEILENTNIFERLKTLFVYFVEKIDIQKLEKDVNERVKEQMEQNQREYYLNEKIKAIGKELGDDVVSEIEQYKQKIDASRMPAPIKEKVREELKKLKNMPPISAESSVIRIYIDWLLDVPWKTRTRMNTNLTKAEKILDEDHFGLEKVKERILETLAVGIRTKKVKGPILCLVGPPGVGKTSLAKSIARACGRQYVRMSLGGVRDESEIRGHRRTYVGALPGRIIQGMKKVGKSNPLFLLDEIDKMGMDHRGDPASALLEVLDPAQNSTFSDHYMEVDYDLSDVMFITTANSYDMPIALRDRMEIISIAGYTEDEKVQIAKQHLLGRALKDIGLKDNEVSFKDDALLYVIRRYTRESGVRNLERALQRLCRKALKSILLEKDTKKSTKSTKSTKSKKSKKSVHITVNTVRKYLGVEKFSYGQIIDENMVGVVTGLAWTSVGGDILHIESVLVHGKGKIQKTGKLGTVMQESISAAETYVRSKASELGILKGVYEKRDIHIHVPEGATPKDGPSAGIAMVTAMVSALTQNPVNRYVAMTGEVTLHGKILPIGGLKEKLLAALRAGIKIVLIPKENEKDLQEIPKTIKDQLDIIAVKDVAQVLDIALTEPLTAVDWAKDDLVMLPPPHRWSVLRR